MSISPRGWIPSHTEFGSASVLGTYEPSLFFEGIEHEFVVVASTVVAAEAVEVGIMVGYLWMSNGRRCW
jgi:hypothetical protein